jgi:hypothetical protein
VRRVRKDPPYARDAVGERVAVDELKDERTKVHASFTRALLEAVDRADVRMLERGQDLRFALESREPFSVGREELGQDLQRDVAAETRIARAIHLTHAAGAKRAGDLIRTETRADDQCHMGSTAAIL